MDKISLSDYDIIFDDSLQSLAHFLSKNKYTSCFVLVDENTKQHCLPILQNVLQDVIVIETQSGEINKNLSTCEHIWQQLIQHNADRKALFINLGGGVIGDMGGFAASCYKRGIDFINIPTTLLSQVDSSIGGKLGIDFKYGKNLIGLFRNPKAVLISSQFFKTLPQRQFINGWAEIFKHALIQDKSQWEKYKDIDILHTNMNDIVYHSLLIKKEVVEEDPFEKGWRKILNFGHTIGHAVEAYSLENDQEPLLHGEAIAAGMLMEGYIGTITSGFSTDNLQQLEKVFLAQYGHYFIPKGIEDALWNSMKLDKKNSGAKVMSVVLKSIGEPDIDVEITQDLLHKALFYYRTLS